MRYNRVMNIELSKLKEIEEELEGLRDHEVLTVTEDGEKRFAVLPWSYYEQIEELAEMIADANKNPVQMITGENFDISYEEYESIRDQIIEALEKTLMPKPEKLN